jgi:hypothetical protein
MRVGDPEQLPFPGVGSRRRAAEPVPVGQAAAPLVWVTRLRAFLLAGSEDGCLP